MRFVIAALAVSAFGQTAFVPADFRVPTEYRTAKFKLVPLGPEIVKQDYDAYMSSIEHLRTTFSGGGSWPHKDLTMANAMKEMQSEAERFRARRSFAYGVLTLDGSKELGSVYVRPSRKQGYDAVVTLWVTKEQFDRGFEAELLPAVRTWMAKGWPFSNVAYPKRDIAQEAWNALLDK